MFTPSRVFTDSKFKIILFSLGNQAVLEEGRVLEEIKSLHGQDDLHLPGSILYYRY